jgi:Flp pilus assembly protein protease CpaA
LSQHPYAAAYCATGPVAGLLYCLYFGFHPNIVGAGDKVLIVVLLLLWARYNFRVLAITRGFPDMPERAAP